MVFTRMHLSSSFNYVEQREFDLNAALFGVNRVMELSVVIPGIMAHCKFRDDTNPAVPVYYRPAIAGRTLEMLVDGINNPYDPANERFIL